MMGGSGIDERLRCHYREERVRWDEGAEPDWRAAVARAAVAESKRAADEAFAGDPLVRIRAFARFVLGQVRFIRRRVWAAQLVLVVVMVALCATTEQLLPGVAAQRTALLFSVLGCASVAVGLPDLMASRTNGTEELECACRFDCRAVMLARMILLGASEVLAMTLAVLVAPAVADTDAFALLLHACAPYFLSCLGCLALARRVGSNAALPAMLAWTVLVMAAALGLYQVADAAYEAASAGAWAFVAVATAALALREARRWLDQAAEGLDRLVAAKPLP